MADLESPNKVESTDWQKDCLLWRNKCKNLEHRIRDLETEVAWYKGYHKAQGDIAESMEAVRRVIDYKQWEEVQE